MKKKTFEQAIARLEEITFLLEEGTHSLEASLALFEEGTELALFCRERLKEAETKVLTLTKTDTGFKTREKSIDQNE